MKFTLGSSAFALCTLFVLTSVGCSSDGSDEVSANTGGAGGFSSGGGASTGGAVASGGVSSGGVASMGGAVTGAGGGPSGGTYGTGGAGGIVSGGATASGGALFTGGTSSVTGGAPATGGAVNTGGAQNTGGTGGATSGVGFVGQHGALRVSGKHVVDAQGQTIQLRGMSLFWSQWTTFDLPATVDQLVDDWKATLVRVPLGVDGDDGYLTNASENEGRVTAVVDRAVQRGLYAIIDWHDSHAESHQSQSVDFFTRMAKKYGSSPGVVFEIYNEPLALGWPSVKSYAEPVIAAIRGAGAKNLVIVGTPNWSQDVDVAAKSPITTDTNLAYTLHFYAATHHQSLRDKATSAINAGLPLFVTEWGTCEASGNGNVDSNETKTWLGFLSQNQISWANWSLNDKAESCSALTPSAGTSGPWSGGDLTTSGALVKPLIP